MKVELEATEQQLKGLKQLIAGKEEYQNIYNQLINALADIDDSQSDEVPTEGDNSIIRRVE